MALSNDSYMDTVNDFLDFDLYVDGALVPHPSPHVPVAQAVPRGRKRKAEESLPALEVRKTLVAPVHKIVCRTLALCHTGGRPTARCTQGRRGLH